MSQPNTPVEPPFTFPFLLLLTYPTEQPILGAETPNLESQFPNVDKWFKNMLTRKTVQKVTADRAGYLARTNVGAKGK